MIIKVNNKDVEAFHLIMKKENALDILSGKKKLEVRTASDFYHKMFVDEDKYKKYQEDLENPEGTMILDDIIKDDVHYVYFTNYNKSWSLIAKIEVIGFFEMTEECVKEIGEYYNFHDFDDEWQEFRDLPSEEVPLFFGIVLGDIVSHKGLK